MAENSKKRSRFLWEESGANLLVVGKTDHRGARTIKGWFGAVWVEDKSTNFRVNRIQ